MSNTNTTQELAPISQTNIHLHKSRDLNRVLYISGVALQQKKSQNLYSMNFAQEIACYLWANYDQELKVEIVSPGLIYIELTPHLLAAFLQHFSSKEVWNEIKIDENQSTSSHKYSSSHQYLSLSKGCLSQKLINSHGSFALQYAHARCCSLIQLAAGEEFINLGVGSASWAIIQPSEIPWLKEEGQLRFVHPAEFCLMSKLIETLDNLDNSFVDQTVKWENIALGLSQSFESFWSNCRIWGEVKINNRELAQARLGLIAITRLVFERVIEEKLGLTAFSEF
ncbi:DALR anticodon-binding domain-containing protein [Mastigocoleus testarum]|uniref:DALR anticodon-binding domain-containing protein n=1 Tax=Mastigocoleus testarum TaxID=996925 RepID=UPI000414AFDC|nr:DALR anticodon-binding domain-containing protein [Mastigocoleus testarum]